MDAAVVEQLREAGIDVSLRERVPSVPIRVDEDGRALPVGDEVMVLSGEPKALVRLKPVTDLFTGDAEPPDFKRGPTPEYMMFFLLIERTAADYCRVTGEIEIDREFQRLYRLLARRPDGSDRNPLFSYLQMAARLYMSLRDVSRAEFETVALRLSKSAKTFAIGHVSRNYHDTISRLV